MHRRLLLLLLPVASVLPACTEDDTPTIGDGSRAVSSTTATGGGSTSTSSGGSTTPSSAASGAIPMSGPSGATGELTYRLDTARSEFCHRITVSGAASASESHVHRLTGEPVLTLTPPGPDGKVDTCAAGDQLLIQELQEAPNRFYVDVHTADGLIRGNLR